VNNRTERTVNICGELKSILHIPITKRKRKRRKTDL
jgi:hypothetical protein